MFEQKTRREEKGEMKMAHVGIKSEESRSKGCGKREMCT